MDSIRAYEAKTRLGQLLDRVARGDSLTITRHGKAVARLVPVAGAACPWQRSTGGLCPAAETIGVPLCHSAGRG